jgi:16S rRNA (cytidine1402-2'-O)-methyltransferase
VSTEPGDSIARPQAGTLFLVATPIGNLGDLSPRAQQILREADLLLAEDTRRTRELLAACGIERAPGTVLSCHEHNERTRTPQVMARLQSGDQIALVSDAGTPLVSDPGAQLVGGAIALGIAVVAIPGPCAAIAALSIAGLGTGRFAFEGFLPPRSAARLDVLRALAGESRTLIFYEAPHRLQASLRDLAQVFGASRRAAVLREMTKRFESAYRGTLAELEALAARDTDMSRGEIVIVVDGAPPTAAVDAEVDTLLRALVAELPVSQAARVAARVTGRARKELYERALALGAAPDAADP